MIRSRSQTTPPVALETARMRREVARRMPLETALLTASLAAVFALEPVTALAQAPSTEARLEAGAARSQTAAKLEPLADLKPRLQAASSSVDAIFAAYDRRDSPGCALGIYQGGEIAYERGYGMANLEHGVTIAGDTVFRIGSTSKQFAALAVLLLEAEGKLSTQDEVRKFLPELQAHTPPVTIEHLVHHTSGVRDYLTLMRLRGERDLDYYTDAEVLDILARQRELNFTPGTEFLYSNSGYFLLSVLVQRVSGKSLAEFAEARIFAPLDMRNSHFHDDSRRIVPRRANGYAPNRSGGGFHISQTTLPMVGDGGVFTTVRDLLLWDQSFYTEELIAAGTREKQLTPARLAGGEPTRYAYGLMVDTYRGQPIVSHGGAFVGYRAELLRFPEQRTSISVLCNLSSTNPSRLARQVADEVLDDQLDPFEPAQLMPPDPILEQVAELEPATWSQLGPLERWLGAWRRNDDLWFLYRQTKSEQDAPEQETVSNSARLLLSTPFAGSLEMEPVRLPPAEGSEPNQSPRFTLRSETPLLALVELIDPDDGGASTKPPILRLRSAPFDLDFTFERAAEQPPPRAVLRGAAGRYYSPELDVHYRLDLIEEPDGPRLWLHVDDTHRDTIDAPLHATDRADLLSTGGLAVELEHQADGRVTGFRLAAGRVKNLLFVRASK